MNRNVARIDHADNLAKTGAHVSTNWLAYSCHYL